MICSQLAHDFRDCFAGLNWVPQYTQTVSLARTSFSSHSGIFHLFDIRNPDGRKSFASAYSLPGFSVNISLIHIMTGSGCTVQLGSEQMLNAT